MGAQFEGTEAPTASPRARAVEFFTALLRERIEYAVVRQGHLLEKPELGELRVLVREDQLDDFEQIARRLRFERHSSREGLEHHWTSNGDAPDRLQIAVTTALRYGRFGVGTGPHETPVLRRCRESSGVMVASACDELVDLVLHCIVDLSSFPDVHRRRVSALVAELRSDPTAAGHAAERVQQELAPALTWATLLEDVLNDRWDDLVARRRRIAGQLVRRDPLSMLRGLTVRPRRDGTLPVPDSAGISDFVSEEVSHVTERAPAASVTRKQIRGSGLMLIGRGLSAGLKFAAELIVVRYLATNEYGAWTYALAAVAFLRGMSALGLNRAISRYLPLHLERGQLDRFYGVLAVVMSLTVLAGSAVVAAFYAFPLAIASLAGVVADQPLDLLFILIFLVPLETVDNALQGVCAALGMSRPIFVRRFLVHPGLRLGIAIALVLASADARMLAFGYLFAGIFGVGYYAWAVVVRLRKQGLLRLKWISGTPLPFRSVLGYTAPVLAADWGAVFMATAGPLLLGALTDMSTVALYQVVIPVAALNHLVPQSFVMLFEPSASRLVARGDRRGLERHYWRTAMWVAVLSFPLFALSFTAAVPLTALLFGERYAAAAPILSLLAVSQFFEATAGFNAETLRVSGKLRSLIAANFVSVVVLVAVSMTLIPALGALGAGIGTAAGQLCYTVLKQVFVRVAVGVKSIDAEHVGFYLTIATVCLVLLVVRLVTPANLWVITPAVLLGVAVVFLSARRSLSVSDTFPELARIPLLTRILG